MAEKITKEEEKKEEKMVRVRVMRSYIDKETGKAQKAGQIITVTAARYKVLHEPKEYVRRV